MALFSLNHITERTDINVPFFNSLIDGVNEALVLQDSGGLYMAIKEYTIGEGESQVTSGSVIISPSCSIDNVSKNVEISAVVYKKTISVNDFAPEGRSFNLDRQRPFVAVTPFTSRPLEVSATITNFSSDSGYFDLLVERYYNGATRVQVFVAGYLNETVGE